MGSRVVGKAYPSHIRALDGKIVDEGVGVIFRMIVDNEPFPSGVNSIEGRGNSVVESSNISAFVEHGGNYGKDWAGVFHVLWSD